MDLQEIINERDKYKIFTSTWLDWNRKKADLLEQLKPSTKERIVYFKDDNLYFLKEGFSSTSILFPIPYSFERRSLLEYNSTQRHPIPYCIIRYQDKYFFTLREKGSGEIRLIGKKGLIGGHINDEDDGDDLIDIIHNGMLREIKEEAGITEDIIKNIELKGLIKSNEGVNADHLAYVFEIELTTDKIKAEEDGVLTGTWIDKKDLGKHYNEFESWSQIVYDNLLK